MLRIRFTTIDEEWSKREKSFRSVQYQYSFVSYNVLSPLVKVLKQTAWKKEKLISGYNPIGSDSRETTL